MEVGCVVVRLFFGLVLGREMMSDVFLLIGVGVVVVGDVDFLLVVSERRVGVC